MVLATVVLLAVDRKLLGKRRGVGGKGWKRGGGVAWAAVGRPPMDASPLAWVRCGAEFYLPAILGFLDFVRFLALFLFPSFPELYHTSPYSDFRVYLSGLHNNALGLRESPSRLGLHNNALGLRELLSRLGLQ